MPELPEVESVRLGLERVAGARVLRVQCGRPVAMKSLLEPGSLPLRELVDCTLLCAERRGKFLRLRFSVPSPEILPDSSSVRKSDPPSSRRRRDERKLSAEATEEGGTLQGGGRSLYLHLGMSGVWLLDPEETRPHTHLTIATDLGTLQYSDPRRFGWICLAEDREPAPEPERWRRLGPDALADDWTARGFHAALFRSSRSLKELLLDQSIVAGVGNIYASEALFAARLDPRRPGTTVTAAEAALLRREARRILRASIRHRGTTFSDYRLTNGRGGGFQNFLKVFQKEGEPCPACGSAISKLTQGARSTFWCPHCQK